RLFLSSRRRHTRFSRDWSSDMCSSDLTRINRNVSMATRKPKGLGRGLDALLGADAGAIATIGKTAAAPEKDGLPSTLPVKLLKAGVYQPRTRMDEGALNELAESIRAQGVMQPILVRPLS